MIRQVSGIVAACLMLGGGAAIHLRAQDPIAAARDLYATAQYDSALEQLDQLTVVDRSPDEQQTIDLYRSLCLLALGRRDDAVRTVERMINRSPLRPGDDVPPRLLAAFIEVKQRVLPVIVQKQYREAKDAFDRKEFRAAASAFRSVIDTMDDRDIVQIAAKPPLADLRTLAQGFEELSVQSLPPPPPPAAPAIEPPPPPAPVPINKIYTAADKDVIPPAIINQELPQFPGELRPGGIRGAIDVVINEAGSVESAKTVVPLGTPYDRILLRAAEEWSYRPARVNGKPVKFLKQIQITIRDKP